MTSATEKKQLKRKQQQRAPSKTKKQQSPPLSPSSPVFSNIRLLQPRMQEAREKSGTGLVNVLRAYIRERAEQVRDNPSLRFDKSWRVDQNDVFYLVRPRALAAGLQINPRGGKFGRKNLIAAIRRVCKEFGKTREELGIIAAERAILYYGGEAKAVGIDEIRRLAEKGVALVFIEKEGICESLAPYAAEVGVALIHSRGFFVEYAQELGYWAEIKGAKIFVLTDLDVSGLLMAIRAQFVRDNPACRIGIDFQTLEELRVSREDVEEPYSPYVTDNKTKKVHPNNHYQALINGQIDVELPGSRQEWIVKFKVDPEILEYIGRSRIEINLVKSAAGTERFWNWLQSRMQQLHPEYDYRRALDISGSIRPDEYEDFVIQVDNLLDKLSEAKNEELREQYKSVEGFIEVKPVQQDIYDEQLEAVEGHDKVSQIMDAISDLKIKGMEEGWWPPRAEGQQQQEEESD
jgi:hypothetical protein